MHCWNRWVDTAIPIYSIVYITIVTIILPISNIYILTLYPTLLLQIKSRFQKTGTKEIKKVAEARMRKRKRATLKLKAAKKQATVMAESNEISERQKLKVRSSNSSGNSSSSSRRRRSSYSSSNSGGNSSRCCSTIIVIVTTIIMIYIYYIILLILTFFLLFFFLIGNF